MLPGRIKAQNSDFKVWEIPGVKPEGEGDHLYVWLRKEGLSTPHILSELARRCGLRARDLGCAGRKDRDAITEQWISLPATICGDLEALPVDGEPQELDGGSWQIVKRIRHARSLRTAQLRGNRFALRVSGLDSEQCSELLRRAEGLAAEGRMLNLYGEQRFVDPGAIAEATDLLGRGNLRDRKAKFLVSIAQAAVFNLYLQKRGWLAEPASGEWYGTDAGGRFDGARDDLATLQKRLDDREIIPLGPMPGRDIQPEGRCAELLSEALSELGLDGVDWAGFGKRLRGSWRSLWVPLCDLSAELDEGAVLLQFSLPAGSYATVLVQRLLEDDWIFPRSC